MAWPATPILPSNVNPGDRITASYTNVQAQAFRDLWTNLQAAQTPWQQPINANYQPLSNVAWITVDSGGVVSQGPMIAVNTYVGTRDSANAVRGAIDGSGHLRMRSGGFVLWSPTDVDVFVQDDVRLGRYSAAQLFIGSARPSGFGDLITESVFADSLYSLTGFHALIQNKTFVGTGGVGTTGPVYSDGSYVGVFRAGQWLGYIASDGSVVSSGGVYVQQTPGGATTVYLHPGGFVNANAGYKVKEAYVIDAGGAFVGTSINTAGDMIAHGVIVARGGQFWVQDAAGTANLATLTGNGLFMNGGVQAILSDGAFVGPGINTAGAILAHGAIVSAGGGILVRDAAQTVNNIVLGADGTIFGYSLDVVDHLKAGGEVRGRRVVVYPQAGDYGLHIRNHTDTNWDWYSDPNGDVITPTGRSLQLVGGSTGSVISWGSNVALRSGFQTLELFNPLQENARPNFICADIQANRVSANAGFAVGATQGASGSFTSQNGKTVTVTAGIITSIV